MSPGQPTTSWRVTSVCRSSSKASNVMEEERDEGKRFATAKSSKGNLPLHFLFSLVMLE